MEVFIKAEINNYDLDVSQVRLWTHACPESILKEIATDSSYTKKALLFAQIEYLRRNDVFDREAYLKWMRIVRNFVCYANISIKAKSSREDLLRAPEAFESMINLINTLADGCNDIYKFLENHTVKPNAYRKEQMTEEILKATKIKKNPQLKDLIWKFEDLDLFRGRITFIFDCAAMINEVTITEEEKLEMLYKVFSVHFNEILEPNLFNRAMLTINVGSEYKYYDYWVSRWNAVSAEKRKFVVSLAELNYYSEKTDSRTYLLQLVLSLLTKDYQQIIDDFVIPADMPEWKIKLIKDPAWIQGRQSDFFAITDDNSKCYLLKSQRPLSEEGGRLVE